MTVERISNDIKPLYMTAVERVNATLQSLVQSGLVRSDFRVQEVTEGGQHFLSVQVYMPYELFSNDEKRHEVYATLESLGDSHTYVDAHVYRYKAN